MRSLNCLNENGEDDGGALVALLLIFTLIISNSFADSSAREGDGVAGLWHILGVNYSSRPAQSTTRGTNFSVPPSVSHKYSRRSTTSGANSSREKCSRITNGLPLAFQPGMTRSASMTPTSFALEASFPKCVLLQSKRNGPLPVPRDRSGAKHGLGKRM